MYIRVAHMNILGEKHLHRVLALLVAAVLFLNSTPAYAKCMTPLVGEAAVSLSSPLQQSVAGATVGFTASITDSEGRPMALLAEVIDPNGEVVERMIASSRISEGDTSFVWKVPTHALSGLYTVQATLVPSEMSYGAAFSDASLPWASAPITIVDGASEGVRFSPTTITSTARADGSVTLAATVANDTDEPYKGRAMWRVFSEIGGMEEAPILERTVDLKIHPRSSASMEYIVPAVTQGVYYVEVDAGVADGRHSAIIDTWIVDGSSVAERTCASDAVRNNTWFYFGILVLILIGGMAASGSIKKWYARK